MRGGWAAGAKEVARVNVKGGVKLDHGGGGKPDHPAAGRRLAEDRSRYVVKMATDDALTSLVAEHRRAIADGSTLLGTVCSSLVFGAQTGVWPSFA